MRGYLFQRQYDWSDAARSGLKLYTLALKSNSGDQYVYRFCQDGRIGFRVCNIH